MSTHDSCLGTALDDWLIELDQAGFHVGVRERLLVQSLFARLSASGELTGSWSLQDLLSLARPLLCTQPDQQRRYVSLLATFVAQHAERSRAGLAERGVQPYPAPKPWGFQYWQGILAALLIGIVAFGVWWWTVPPVQVPVPDLPSNTLPSIPEKSEPKPEPTKLARPIYVPASSMPIAEAASEPGFSASVRIGLLILGSTSLLSLAWLAWARWRRQLYLQGIRTDKEVEERLITDPNPVTIEPPPTIVRLASRMMRQRYAAEREILDVPRTLRATMSAGGALLPRYRAITQTPEYLVLIDRRHPADHHAAYSEVLVTALKRNGVAVEVRYFEGSPQTGCCSLRSTMEGHEQLGATSFAELAGRFSGHRLLVFSDTQALIDEVDGMPCSWATHLQAFPQRAWFTPMPMASWGQAELATDAQGFLVLPIQPESLNTMAGWFSSGQLGLEVGADWPVSYPTMLRGESLAWVVRQTAPPPAALDDVLFQLRNYLGAKRFQWLCACAIFPAISPAITLALGREVTSDARDLALGAAAIGALPWFRHAFMPAWLRLALLDRLDEAHTTRFRQIVEERLAAALEGGSGAPLLTLAERKRRLAAWFRRRSGAARDVVLVDFLHRGTLSTLAQRLPEGLRKRLFRQGLPAYGLTSGVLWVLPLGLLLGLLGLPGVWERVAVVWKNVAAGLSEPNLTPPPRTIDTTLTGHSAAVFTATFSQDGRLVVTASADGTARVWEVATGREVRRFEGHSNSVMSAIFSPDGRLIVTASVDGTARVWDLATGRELRRFMGHAKGEMSATFSPDGRLIVTASADGTARVWEVATGRALNILHHENMVWSAAFSPNGSQIVTVSQDGIARFWNTDTGKQLGILPGHQDRAYSASFRPDGLQIVTASADKTARLWVLPRPPALDLLDCDSQKRVASEVALLADQVAEAVKNKTLPTLAPVAYIPSAWHQPDGISPPQYGTVLYGAEEDRFSAEILAKWLNAETGSTNQPPPTYLES